MSARLSFLGVVSLFVGASILVWGLPGQTVVAILKNKILLLKKQRQDSKAKPGISGQLFPISSPAAISEW